jgi:hypothetical protein
MMEKIIAGLVLLLTFGAVHADPVAYGVPISQRNGANDDNTEYWLVPTPGNPCHFGFGGAAEYTPSCMEVVPPSQVSVSRSLNSAFQVSTTRNALVTYSVRISTTATLSGGQTGDVVLEIASNSGFSSNVQTLSMAENGLSIGIAISITVDQVQTFTVSGFVPAGYYVRLRTVNTAGLPTFAYRAGQEVLL